MLHCPKVNFKDRPKGRHRGGILSVDLPVQHNGLFIPFTFLFVKREDGCKTFDSA